MAIARHGTIGAVSLGTTSQAPTFNVTPSSGDTAIVYVGACFNGTPTTGISVSSGTGWTVVQPNPASLQTGAVTAGIVYKLNCSAGETAPTITCDGSPNAVHVAAELFTGVGAVDQSGVILTTTGVLSCSANDTNASDVATVAWCVLNSKSATYTFSDSWSPSGGSTTHADNGSTKQTNAMSCGSDIIAGNGGSAHDSDTLTTTPSTGALQNRVGQIVSFTPASTAHSIVYQTPIRRSVLLRR